MFLRNRNGPKGPSLNPGMSHQQVCQFVLPASTLQYHVCELLHDYQTDTFIDTLYPVTSDVGGGIYLLGMTRRLFCLCCNKYITNKREKGLGT